MRRREVALPPSNAWRAPRLLVLADGVPLAGVEAAEVLSGGYFSADMFRVRAALTGGIGGWAATTAAAIDVQIALSPVGGFVSLLQGQVDTIGLDPVAAELTLEGRDLSALLIEARTQEIFANQTASEIATTLAGRHGLAADVQTTSTPVGRFWELEHDSLTLDAGTRATTEWDLLATLAGWEGFDLWVSQGALHFRPPEIGIAPMLLTPEDFVALRLDRALTFAGDINVTVKSWHSRLGSMCVASAGTERGGVVRDYVFVVPNLTPDAAQTLAQRKLDEISRHELLLRGEMPGELTLSPRMMIQLVGTNSIFDRVWQVDAVDRHLSMRDGFTQTVTARASSTG